MAQIFTPTSTYINEFEDVFQRQKVGQAAPSGERGSDFNSFASAGPFCALHSIGRLRVTIIMDSLVLLDSVLHIRVKLEFFFLSEPVSASFSIWCLNAM